MKIVYSRQDSGVVAGGIFFAPGVPMEVPDELGRRLIKSPHFRVHYAEKRERTTKSKREKTGEEKE